MKTPLLIEYSDILGAGTRKLKIIGIDDISTAVAFKGKDYSIIGFNDKSLYDIYVHESIESLYERMIEAIQKCNRTA